MSDVKCTHNMHPAGDPTPAEWMVSYVAVKSCGCPGQQQYHVCCRSCLERRFTPGVKLFCMICKAQNPDGSSPWLNVDSVSRLP